MTGLPTLSGPSRGLPGAARRGGVAAGGVPVNTVLPAITGTVIAGETLTCSTGTWTNSPISYAYQWTRDGSNIGGATSPTYELIDDDVGALIACDVGATNAAGSGSATAVDVGPVQDADAQAYITAVETADGQELETAVRDAINDFVVGCKADGIWDALKASCILAGARTLTGALVPLKGTAPTNFNFVPGDYNRTTGLVGDGSTKWLNSNRSHLADPLNSVHLSVFQSTAFSAGVVIIGNSVIPRCAIYTAGWAIRTSTVTGSPATNATGFLGASRSTSGSYLVRTASSTISISSTSDSLSDDDNYGIYARTNGGYSNARLAFYSIGESLDLALLDARVTALINAYAAVIP